MRGEYIQTELTLGIDGELPPHARRILTSGWLDDPHNGTTSACAENTGAQRCVVQRPWNYLRMRGEYLTRLSETAAKGELPPHARRIPSLKW